MIYQYNNHTLTSEQIMLIHGRPKLKLKSAKKGKYGYELKYINEYGGINVGFLSSVTIDKYLNK